MSSGGVLLYSSVGKVRGINLVMEDEAAVSEGHSAPQ